MNVTTSNVFDSAEYAEFLKELETYDQVFPEERFALLLEAIVEFVAEGGKLDHDRRKIVRVNWGIECVELTGFAEEDALNTVQFYANHLYASWIWVRYGCLLAALNVEDADYAREMLAAIGKLDSVYQWIVDTRAELPKWRWDNFVLASKYAFVNDGVPGMPVQ